MERGLRDEYERDGGSLLRPAVTRRGGRTRGRMNYYLPPK